MKIVVALHTILDPAGIAVNRKVGRVFVNREHYIINPADSRALEMALTLKDANGATIIAAGIGSETVTDVLRDALAAGADRALRLEAPDGATPAADKLFAALCQSIGEVALVLTGDRLLSTGAMPAPAIAQRLGIAYVGGAVKCVVKNDEANVIAADSTRFMDYSITLPAVVGVSRTAPRCRYAHGASIIEVYRNPNAVEVLSLADLKFSEDEVQSPMTTRGQSFAPEREFGKEVTIEAVAAILKG